MFSRCVLPSSTFTFISSSHDTVSWLDHILTITSGYSISTDICVKSDFITSDHLPLCFTVSVDNLNMPISSSANNIPCDALRYNWYGASDFNISNYYYSTRAEFSIIKLHNHNSVVCRNDYVSQHYNISRTDFKWWMHAQLLITAQATGQFIMQ